MPTTKFHVVDTQESMPSTSSQVAVDDPNNLISLTEEEQLEIAIKKSLQEAGAAVTVNSDDSDDYEEPTDDESEAAGSSRTTTPRKKDASSAAVAATTSQSPETDENGPKTRLMLRLPNGKSEMINRSSTSSIGELVSFIKRTYKSLISLETCRINCPAIRKDLCDMEKSQTLEEAKLHPSAVLHISSDD